MIQNKSKNHHFIPQFYIKGFADLNNNVYMYNTLYKKINKTPKKSAQIFYQEDLHTAKLFGEKTAMIEDFYSGLEGHLSKLISEINNISNNYPPEVFSSWKYDDSIYKVLMLIVSVQFWRNPKNKELAEKMAEKLNLLYENAICDNSDILFFEKKDIKYIYKKRKTESMKKVIQFLVLPLITFKFTSETIPNLQVIKIKDYDKDLICSDNPVYISEMNDQFIVTGDFIFPLTKDILLTNIKNIDYDEIQKTMILNASEKVIGSSVELLDYLTHKTY
ncbi:DUF4238 domain-containing protein [Photobacterium piscicola]|uniref:DUF4238 domain-containing protein n=1 Tax=Photobacterium piscicola TaxID=1378299 RepID=UPI002E16D7EC|nr:DUF4238 domain-containing protein [Photobacterium piscicola]